jgi:flagellar motor switch protein FliN/FliY
MRTVKDKAGQAIRPVVLEQLGSSPGRGAPSVDLGALRDLELRVSVELGSATMPLREVLELGPGAVIELDRLIGEPVDVLVNGHPVGRGEVVAIGDAFGVRLTEILAGSPPDHGAGGESGPSASSGATAPGQGAGGEGAP